MVVFSVNSCRLQDYRLSSVSMEQVRAGLEMAIFDALAHSVGMPLWWLFGGHSNTVVTDITVRHPSTAGCSRLFQTGFQDRKTVCDGLFNQVQVIFRCFVDSNMLCE